MTTAQTKTKNSPSNQGTSRNGKNNEIRVLIADDHEVVREGFKLLLEREAGIKVIGEAKTGDEAVQLTATLHPDLILMDISMPGINGLQSAHTVLTRHPDTKIIILSMYDDDEFIQHAIRIGVHGFILKEGASSEVIRAIKEVVINGNPCYAPAIQRRAFNLKGAEHKIEAGRGTHSGGFLTPRELEVLQLIAKGKANQEISKLLIVSVKTVQKHRQQLMDKLNIHDAVGLTRYAIQHGISKV